MEIIDIHTHIYPDKIARKATDSVRDFYQIEGSNMDGTVDMLLRQGSKAGISRYVVLPVSNRCWITSRALLSEKVCSPYTIHSDSAKRQ